MAAANPFPNATASTSSAGPPAVHGDAPHKRRRLSEIKAVDEDAPMGHSPINAGEQDQTEQLRDVVLSFLVRWEADESKSGRLPRIQDLVKDKNVQGKMDADVLPGDRADTLNAWVRTVLDGEVEVYGGVWGDELKLCTVAL